jgi:hypothetical protein
MKRVDPSKLKVGDVIYTYEETNNFPHRRKTHRVIDGEDWFKYNMPLRTYSLITCEVLGILRKSLEGSWKDGNEYDLETEFHVRHKYDTLNLDLVETIEDTDDYFLDRDEILEYIKNMEMAAKELDKT